MYSTPCPTKLQAENMHLPSYYLQKLCLNFIVNLCYTTRHVIPPNAFGNQTMRSDTKRFKTIKNRFRSSAHLSSQTVIPPNTFENETTRCHTIRFNTINMINYRVADHQRAITQPFQNNAQHDKMTCFRMEC